MEKKKLTLYEIDEDLKWQLSEGMFEYFYRDELEVTMSDPKEVQYFKENAFELHLDVFQLVANACYRVKSNELREAFVFLLDKTPTRVHRCSCGGALALLSDPLGYKVLEEFIDDPLPPDDTVNWLVLADTLILLHSLEALEMIKRQRLDFRVPKGIRDRAQNTIDGWNILNPTDYY